MRSLHFSPKVFVLIGALLVGAGVALAGASPQDMVVTSVAHGSPAEAAGLAAGDVILSVDGTALSSPYQLAATVNRKWLGETIALSVQAPDQAQPKDVIMNITRESSMNAAPWLGFDVAAAGQQAAASTAMTPATGAYVASVEPGSSASFAGLVPGDVILSFNGTTLDAQHQLVDLMDLTPIGQLVSLSVQGAGQTQPMDVRLNVARRSATINSPWLGLSVFQSSGAPVTLPANGAYVASVDVNSPAATAGLRSGEVILSVDGTVVDAQHPLADLIDKKSVGETVRLTVQVPGQTAEKDLTVTLEKNPDKAANPWLGVSVASSGSPSEVLM